MEILLPVLLGLISLPAGSGVPFDVSLVQRLESNDTDQELSPLMQIRNSISMSARREDDAARYANDYGRAILRLARVLCECAVRSVQEQVGQLLVEIAEAGPRATKALLRVGAIPSLVEALGLVLYTLEATGRELFTYDVFFPLFLVTDKAKENCFRRVDELVEWGGVPLLMKLLDDKPLFIRTAATKTLRNMVTALSTGSPCPQSVRTDVIDVLFQRGLLTRLSPSVLPSDYVDLQLHAANAMVRTVLETSVKIGGKPQAQSALLSDIMDGSILPNAVTAHREADRSDGRSQAFWELFLVSCGPLMKWGNDTQRYHAVDHGCVELSCEVLGGQGEYRWELEGVDLTMIYIIGSLNDLLRNSSVALSGRAKDIIFNKSGCLHSIQKLASYSHDIITRTTAKDTMAALATGACPRPLTDIHGSECPRCPLPTADIHWGEDGSLDDDNPRMTSQECGVGRVRLSQQSPSCARWVGAALLGLVALSVVCAVVVRPLIPSWRQSTTSSGTRAPESGKSAAVVAQLKGAISEAVAKTQSLESSLAAAKATRSRVTQREDQLKEDIKQLKQQTTSHNLSRDALAALTTSAAIGEFADNIANEEGRLEQLHGQLWYRVLDIAKTGQHQQQQCANDSIDSDRPTTTHRAEGCSSADVSPSASAVDAESLTKELRQMLKRTINQIKKFEGDIARERGRCASLETDVAALEQQRRDLQQKAAAGLTEYRLSVIDTATDVEAFKRDITSALQQLRALSKKASEQQGILQQKERAAAEQAMQDGTCVACLERPPSVVFFPCKQRCLCAGCWAEMSHNHERAKREMERLRRRGVPDKAMPMWVQIDGVLKCPACLTRAVYATDLEGVKATT
ncbi:unnamed protein product [Vitrella brassicaformis CCMP3155]|uniref:RING-type domain-containing protein n=1 Tax=Vitrella brassicaformis (strain CCMP3155) TaxID=1169540 RepID=A0A0G4H689_VITBC|nr:unnamed protein product [Vitrella brassicaformis CCMP3155]|eukprot:CEM39374.1 unnamed protein product [Vitrella brassicaformis CCMP3155]